MAVEHGTKLSQGSDRKPRATAGNLRAGRGIAHPFELFAPRHQSPRCPTRILLGSVIVHLQDSETDGSQDSPLEGDGFELPVPRAIRLRFRDFALARLH